MKYFVTSEFRKFSGYCQFPCRWRTINKNEFHKSMIKKLSFLKTQNMVPSRGRQASRPRIKLLRNFNGAGIFIRFFGSFILLYHNFHCPAKGGA